VARVMRGLQAPVVTSVLNSYVQCQGSGGSGQSIKFREGFESSFKTKGFEQVLANGTISGGRYVGNGTFTSMNTTGGTGTRQNVPGAAYNTESGFTADYAQVTPSPNPPAGIGNGSATGGGNFNSGSRLTGAGVASQGTRLYVAFRDIPNGLTVSVPLTVALKSAATGLNTGVAVLVTTATNGADTSAGFALASSGVVNTSLLAVYEIAMDDPSQIEDLTIPVTVAYNQANIASNLPEPFKTSSVSGGFAPYYDDTVAVHTASTTLPTPRFRNLPSPFADLFRINKCSCNLLFPFVTNAAAPGGNYDTGIAIANTSLLPAGFGFNPGVVNPVGQEGAVQFWYYPALSTATPITSCDVNWSDNDGKQLTGVFSLDSTLSPLVAGAVFATSSATFGYADRSISTRLAQRVML